MKKVLVAIAFAAAAVSGRPALAKGCVKDAAVGGLGGHMAGKGHGMAAPRRVA